MNHQTELMHQRVEKKLNQIKGWRQAGQTEIVKHCSCGNNYRLSEWRKLTTTGITAMPDDGGPPFIEFRDCPCGSTLSIAMDRKKREIVRVANYLTTMNELGRIAEVSGYVRVPASDVWGSRTVSARVLLGMRGTELEVLFALGIEVV